MTKQRVNGMAWAVVAALSVPAMAMAQAAGPQTGTPAGGVQVQQQDRYVVGRALPPEVPGTQRIEMTLEQAIERALEKNLDIQSAKLSPQMQDYTLQAARAAFKPTFSGSTRYSNSARASTSSLDGASRLVSDSQTFNVSANQRLPWYGATASINFNNTRSADNSSNTLRNPNYRASTSLSYTQPLWQNLKIDSQRNALKTGEIQKTIVDIQLQTQIENIKNQVRVRYWALRQAIEAIEIQRRALALANQSLADSKVRVEIGTLAEIDLVQQESQIATSEQQLLNTEITWRNAELAFKRLLVESTTDELFRATIIPTELPSFAEQTVDIPAAVKQALNDRTDIVQLRQNLRIADLNMDLSKNSTKPALDLQASYSLEGTGGNFSQGGVIIASGYSDALSTLLKRETPAWSLQLNVNYPLGMAAQKANLARAQLQYSQSEIQIKNQELTIETAVTTAGLDVQSAYKQLLAAQKSREFAERSLEAELTRFGVGMSTNYQVIDFQNRLTSSRNSELAATIRYINAVAEFDRVQRIGG